MALLISNDDTRQVLPFDMNGMSDVLQALEESYKEEGLGRAANRTKSGIYMPTERPDEWHQLITFAGGVRHLKVSAIRIRPEIAYVDESHGNPQYKDYTRERGTFGELDLLFSAEDGQLLAILNDASIQSLRVGASAGLAARHMARRNTKVVGILGSSGIARTHALAYAHAVPNMEKFRIYSPVPENRETFANWVRETTGLPAEAVDGPEAMADGADIIAACTNHVGSPVITAEWLKPGRHFTFNQFREVDSAAYPLFHRYVEYASGVMDHHFTTPPDQRPPYISDSTAESDAALNVIPRRHHLCEVLLGKAPGRESDGEINLFRSEGTAVQFATMASMVYHRCREAGIGRELDPEWFLQSIRS